MRFSGKSAFVLRASVLVAVLAASVGGLYGWTMVSPSSSERTRKTEPSTIRAARLAMSSRSGLTQQTARGYVEEDGPKQMAMDDVHVLLRSMDVPIEEQKEYYSNNRALFGERSFERSRSVVERLIRLEKAREILATETLKER